MTGKQNIPLGCTLCFDMMAKIMCIFFEKFSFCLQSLMECMYISGLMYNSDKLEYFTFLLLYPSTSLDFEENALLFVPLHLLHSTQTTKINAGSSNQKNVE